MNILKFFTKVTSLTPTEDQSKLLLDLANLDIKQIIASAGRQTGKTLCCAVAVLWWVFERKDSIKILLISAQYSILYYHIKEIFKRCPEFESSIVAQGTYSIVPLRGFETKKGDIISVRGSTDKQVRGIPADIVIIDEACEIKDDIILTAMGNLSGPISKFILISTPHISKSLFVKWASDPKEHGFKLHTWSSETCKWHSKLLLATKKKEFSQSKYAVEVLGRPPTKAERAFFPHKHILKCVVEDLMPEGGEREAGLDFGQVVGKNILTIVEKNKSRRKVLYQKHYRKPLEEVLEEISTTCTRFKVKVIKADSKPPEYQKIVGKKLGGILVVYVDARYHKDRMLGQLQRHIQHHTIEWDRKLLALTLELKKYRKGKRAGDDRVDSLVLAVYEMPYSTKPTPTIHISTVPRG